MARQEVIAAVFESLANPYLVNQEVSREDRRVPFENIVYVGDGLTDIPCFSLLKASGGTPFGVFDPGREESAKRAFQEFLLPDRVIGMHAAKYGPTDELGALIRTAVQAKISDSAVRRLRPDRIWSLPQKRDHTTSP